LLIKDNFLICLVGLPASGKTTFAYQLKGIIEKNIENFNVIIIDPDKIRDQLSPNKFDHNKEQIVREKNFKAINTSLKDNNIVISDDLNYYSSMRHDLKEIADRLDIKFFIIHIATPLKTCLNWNKKRGKPIPNKVIKKIYNKFDTFDKYSWDNPIIEYDPSSNQSNKGKFEEVLSAIVEKLIFELTSKRKIEKLSEDSNIDNEKLDRVTREIVGDLLRNPMYKSFKNKIIVYRKLFVKDNLNRPISEKELSISFKKYLEKSLDIKNV